MATATRVIKTRDEYDAALTRADALMDADLGTAEGDELEVLAVLIEMYEAKAFPIGLPSVPGAIRFRMNQAGLHPRDLVPYIGSAARVSEVLAGKRPLTLKMARALHRSLGIPAEVLLQEEEAGLPEEASALDWGRFPISAMVKAGWFPGFVGNVSEAVERAEELMRGLFARAGTGGMQPALLRAGVRSGAEMDIYALTAWQARVLEIVREKPLSTLYRRGTVDEAFIRAAVGLSYLDDGPRVVQDFLGKSGIHLVILNHLPRTHLDGAATRAPNGNPVIALTLRYDRLDNFWFCLAHELAHVALHLDTEVGTSFYDDLDMVGDGIEQIERDADDLAQRALIDSGEWANSAAARTHRPNDVQRLAQTLRISPAIVAGRVRYESRNYRVLTRLLGLGDVRRHFPNAKSGE
jgi:HTH-type transcriptional regulator / antitoxin HigA